MTALDPNGDVYQIWAPLGYADGWYHPANKSYSGPAALTEVMAASDPSSDYTTHGEVVKISYVDGVRTAVIVPRP